MSYERAAACSGSVASPWLVDELGCRASVWLPFVGPHLLKSPQPYNIPVVAR